MRRDKKLSERRSDIAEAELFTPERWRQLGRWLGLPPRQLAVARLICAEYTKARMGRQLGVAPDTIGTHLKALFRRLGATTRAGIVVRLVLAERELALTGSQAATDDPHDRVN